MGEQGLIPLLTIGDSAFPQLAWLVKGFDENTHDKKERYYNKKHCKSCYGKRVWYVKR